MSEKFSRDADGFFTQGKASENNFCQKLAKTGKVLGFYEKDIHNMVGMDMWYYQIHKKKLVLVISVEDLEKVFDSIKEDFINDKLEDDDPLCIIAEIRTRLRRESEKSE